MADIVVIEMDPGQPTAVVQQPSSVTTVALVAEGPQGPPGLVDSDVHGIIVTTRAEWEALPEKDPDTLYLFTS